jgi:hypothetical protein
MPPFHDLTGRRFGRLTAQWPAGIKGKKTIWLTLCKCGVLALVSQSNLVTGHARSCTCWRRERSIIGNRTHGNCRRLVPPSPEYQIYKGMLQRCTNPNGKAWKHYGGRGIKVCRRWSGPRGFQNFLTDMGRRPGGKGKSGRAFLSLDRYPDPDGNYEPGNVRWATAKQQQENKRKRK